MRRSSKHISKDQRERSETVDIRNRFELKTWYRQREAASQIDNLNTRMLLSLNSDRLETPCGAIVKLDKTQGGESGRLSAAYPVSKEKE